MDELAYFLLNAGPIVRAKIIGYLLPDWRVVIYNLCFIRYKRRPVPVPTYILNLSGYGEVNWQFYENAGDHEGNLSKFVDRGVHFWKSKKN